VRNTTGGKRGGPYPFKHSYMHFEEVVSRILISQKLEEIFSGIWASVVSGSIKDLN
jgi:hypothetical protein